MRAVGNGNRPTRLPNVRQVYQFTRRNPLDEGGLYGLTDEKIKIVKG